MNDIGSTRALLMGKDDRYKVLMGLHDERINSSAKLNITQRILIILLFIILCYGAYNIKVKYCPDEFGRKYLSDYIAKNNALPIGDEQEILIDGWGFSYALRPYLSSIIGALFTKLFSLFTVSEGALLLASRSCSVISITGLSYFCFRIGNIIFKKKQTSIIFSVIVCFLPQVVYIGMYQNNDALSLFCVSAILFYLIKGSIEHWRMRSCVILGVWVALCLLSYYSAYSWLLIGGGYFLYLLHKDQALDFRNKIKRIAIIACVAFALSGWFFIRNAYIHDGDILGMATEEKYRSDLEQQGVELYQYNRPSEKEGNTLFAIFTDNNHHWLTKTTRSFVGYFGYWTIELDQSLYDAYYLYFGIGILLFLWLLVSKAIDKKSLELFLLFLFSSVGTICLSVYQSYYRDYQPQGRYIITCIILFAFMIAYGADNIWIEAGIPNAAKYKKSSYTLAICIIWIVLFLRVFFGSMLTMLE